MVLKTFNDLGEAEVKKHLFNSCGSHRWVNMLMQHFPFENEEHLITAARNTWYDECGEADWKEAFLQHPKIGDTKGLAEKFSSTQHFAGNEQAGVAGSSEATLTALAHANVAYELKFGFIFIVCATDKSAAEMLRLLHDRLLNSADEELYIAMGEQHKITILRLKKILKAGDWSFLKPSQITTHVLNTSLGMPGESISVRLRKKLDDKWQLLAQGITNSDGRVGDLLPAGREMGKGIYKITFNTGDFFIRHKIEGFYPEVEIQFNVFDGAHYHVPLLINPFGYSTYRGS